MNRFVKFLLSFALVFTIVTPITAFAAEITVGGEPLDYNTFFTRIWEFVENNSTAVISAAGSGLVLVANAIMKAANSKSAKQVSEQLVSLMKDTGSVVDVINQMIVGYNSMKDSNEHLEHGYADMKAAYEANALKEDDRNRLIGAVMVQNTAILEMFASIYVHNKNLPQGVRDLVILKYANTLKALDDDAMLCSIVEAVREKINFEAPVEEAVLLEETDIVDSAAEIETAEE
jgi:hypothetical protein